MDSEIAHDPADEALSSLGLVLILAAIISTALWLSMIGGSGGGASAALTGVTTIVLFIASFACFAADQPADCGDAGEKPGPISSGRCPTAP